MFTEEERKQVVAAIQAAERNTSGEIKVHVEKKCPLAPLARAEQLFVTLQMQKTQLRNGVLFYIALDDHKFAICGDSGINNSVSATFWESTKELMRDYFRQNKLVEGLCAGIEQAGQQLKMHFPYQSDDINELPDDISFGE